MADNSAEAKRTVRCPKCGKPAVFSSENPCRPFCSERCRTTDLGTWASEGYRVASDEKPSDDNYGDDDSEGSQEKN